MERFGFEVLGCSAVHFPETLSDGVAPTIAFPDGVWERGYSYVNCKMDEPNNSGVFVRQSTVMAPLVPTKPGPLDLSPTPSP